MWKALHQLSRPERLYQLSGRLVPWFAISGLAALLLGWVWGFGFAPADYQQGDSFRIEACQVILRHDKHGFDENRFCTALNDRLYCCVKRSRDDLDRSGRAELILKVISHVEKCVVFPNLRNNNEFIFVLLNGSIILLNIFPAHLIKIAFIGVHVRMINIRNCQTEGSCLHVDGDMGVFTHHIKEIPVLI